MARPATYSEDIGLDILQERDRGTPWKVLVTEYGLCRTRLYGLMKAAEKQRQSAVASSKASPDQQKCS